MIDKLEKSALNFGTLADNQERNIKFDDTMEKINADMRGIYVMVLVKHKIVKDFREVIRGYRREKEDSIKNLYSHDTIAAAYIK